MRRAVVCWYALIQCKSDVLATFQFLSAACRTLTRSVLQSGIRASKRSSTRCMLARRQQAWDLTGGQLILSRFTSNTTLYLLLQALHSHSRAASPDCALATSAKVQCKTLEALERVLAKPTLSSSVLNEL